MSLNGSTPAPTAHEGHTVHPHSHDGQNLDKRPASDWCSGRWLCVTCRGKDAPKGTWFDGPKCVRPKMATKGEAG